MDKTKFNIEELRVINMGLVDFAKSLAVQNVKVVHVDWRPPASGDEALQKILNALLA